ncbi:unnamed protein product [Brachionus calyciflorus]|uniref:EGF-like domain-containing protein n=1 Tax=Brachionus calyciflorus TaxID=104777 RepID=A0A814LGK5_9BILA|nr:unnamed protein product [Brachionus calyciflorus]
MVRHSIEYSCPFLCNTCQSTSSSSTDKTNLIETTITFKTCAYISCLNGGYLDPLSCKCVCLPGFTGQECSTLVCSSISDDPDECRDLGDICDDPDLKLFCLKKCSCSNSISPSVPFKTCAPLSCQNGGNLDLNSCKCVCLPGFSGENCESINCSQNLEDPTECSDLKPFCNDDADIKNYCFRTCNC